MFNYLTDMAEANGWADEKAFDALIWAYDNAEPVWADDHGYDDANPEYDPEY